MERFRYLGGGRSGGGGGGASKKAAASFLQLPLPKAASSSASPAELVPQGGGSQPALHELLASPSAPPLSGHQHGVGVPAVGRGTEISPALADADAIKARIMSHPLYSPLLASYLDCQKVGAPPAVLDRLSAMAVKLQLQAGASPSAQHEPPRADPELDQFMEAYCNMVAKYREELLRPIHEAAEFFKSVEAQLNSITDMNNYDGGAAAAGSSEEEEEQDLTSCPDEMDPSAEDKELKQQLLRKYGGYVGGLRQEFCKRRKKGKLPKEARHMLLQWWQLHTKWPYPSETEKMALAESTGLDQKQINNWFINQRKRHWKPPSEEMLSAMDGAAAPWTTAAALYSMDRPFMPDGLYRPLGS